MHQNLLIENEENYQKQTYRNRCKILTSNKLEVLTVPIIDSTKKIVIKEVKIDNTQNWQSSHWRTIQSGYGKSPFFEFYADNLRVIFKKQYSFLFDLNQEILTLCLKWLKVAKEVSITTEYNKSPEIGVYDLRSVISAKNDNRPYNNFVFEQYTQVFGNKFAPNLSIIDLICCEGPNSINVLATTIKKSLN